MPTPESDQLTANLQRAWVASPLDQHQLAAAAAVDTDDLYLVLAGARSPSSVELARLADALDTTPEELLGQPSPVVRHGGPCRMDGDEAGPGIARTNPRAKPDSYVTPSSALRSALWDHGMTQAELARRMGRPTQAISEIITGKKSITAETAIQIERVLGTPARYWLHLDADHRLRIARRARGQEHHSAG